MPVRERRQAFIARVMVEMKGPLTQLVGGRAREGTVQRILLCEHHNIRLAIAPGERFGGRSPAIADPAAVAELTDQPGHLGPGSPGDLLQIVPDHSPVGPAERSVPELLQVVPDPPVGFLPGRGFKIKRGGTVQKRTDLIHR